MSIQNKGDQKEKLLRVLERGDLYFERGKYAEALECYDRALRIDEMSVSALMGRGAALHAMEEYRGALAAALDGIRRFPDEHRFYFNAGLASNMLDDNGAAIDYFSQALDVNSEYALAYYARGNCYYFWEQYDKAFADYSRSLEYGIDQADVFLSAGLCLEKRGDYREALALYRIGREEAPEIPLAARIAVCLYITEPGADEESLELLERALEGDPLDREAGVYRALILRERERFEAMQSQIDRL